MGIHAMPVKTVVSAKRPHFESNADQLQTRYRRRLTSTTPLDNADQCVAIRNRRIDVAASGT
jgi:hypothetical protein